MNDYILRAATKGEQVRAFISYNKDTVQKAREIHDTSPVASAALGRTLIVASLMGAMLKNDSDLITIQIKGDGPIRGIVVVADNKSNVKGYIYNPNVSLPLNKLGKLDVGGAIGTGSLIVIKDLGLKNPYIGQTELVTGEIAEDFTYYFTVSEQLPSAVALGVLVDKDTSIKHAGGFIIQVMPECEEITLSTLEQNISKINSITNLFEQGNLPEDILKIIFEGIPYTIYETQKTDFKCNCSKERVEKALISIGMKDLQDILGKDKKAELNCHFCNKNYVFDEEHIRRLIDSVGCELK
ncbi:MAG TPA: Hsp33 family molecular chaperone HslO [Clostridiales bacterium]|nr:MAG: Hsp33 family molecular chaperone [Clostridiales bacterium GWD2_32_59]HAN10165.1 Hsp33 family molecular chaperone HslO [Clostridiales bacterium]